MQSLASLMAAALVFLLDLALCSRSTCQFRRNSEKSNHTVSATSSIQLEFLTKFLQPKHLRIWTLEGLVTPFLYPKWYPLEFFCCYSIQKISQSHLASFILYSVNKQRFFESKNTVFSVNGFLYFFFIGKMQNFDATQIRTIDLGSQLCHQMFKKEKSVHDAKKFLHGRIQKRLRRRPFSAMSCF